jgi:hypothetical protein
MAVKKKIKLSLFHIYLHRGKLAPSLVGVKAAKDGDSAISAFLATGMGVPGNAGKLDCGHKSISVRYEAVKVA